MKTHMLVIVSILCLSSVACKGAVQDAQYPQAQTPPPPTVPPRAAECAPRDNFDAAGQMAADGSRYAWEKTKEYSIKAYDASVKAYDEYQANKKAEEEKSGKSSSEP